MAFRKSLLVRLALLPSINERSLYLGLLVSVDKAGRDVSAPGTRPGLENHPRLTKIIESEEVIYGIYIP